MRLRTIGVVVTVALELLAARLAADAQPPVRVARIGHLSQHAPSELDEAFRKGLRELGYA